MLRNNLIFVRLEYELVYHSFWKFWLNLAKASRCLSFRNLCSHQPKGDHNDLWCQEYPIWAGDGTTYWQWRWWPGRCDLIFLPGFLNWGLYELTGDAPFGLFKDRQVLPKLNLLWRPWPDTANRCLVTSHLLTSNDRIKKQGCKPKKIVAVS